MNTLIPVGISQSILMDTWKLAIDKLSSLKLLTIFSLNIGMVPTSLHQTDQR